MTANKFLLMFVFFFSLLSLPIAMNALFLFRAGEFLPLQDVVEIQQKSQGFCIYGTAIHDDTYYAKLEGFRRKKPNIVAIGSSRIMQMRAQFFKDTFYNLGGTVRSTNDIHNIISDILAVKTPKVVLLNLDFWWFHPSYHAYYTDRPPVRSRITLGNLFLPFIWLKEGKINLKEYTTILKNGWTTDPCSIGIRALHERSGMGPDGSNYYSVITAGERGASSRNIFAEAISHIHAGEGSYAHAEKANDESIDALITIVRMLEAKGVTVRLFIPPMAPTVFAAMHMEGNKYAFVDDLRSKLRMHHIVFVDAHDPSTIKATDCEFVDEYHGGDIVAAKIARALSQTIPKGTSIFDVPYLQKAIQHSIGHAMIPDARVSTKPERDFLHIGCQK